MILQTIGHASILLRNKKNEPVLLSDPWLLGSCYWRSWWLQNIEELLDLPHINLNIEVILMQRIITLQQVL